MDSTLISLKIQPGVYTFQNIADGVNIDLTINIERYAENDCPPPTERNPAPIVYGRTPEKRDIKLFRQTWLITEHPDEDTDDTGYTIMNLMSGTYLTLKDGSSGQKTSIVGKDRVEGDDSQLWVFFQTDTDKVVRIKNVKGQTFADLSEDGDVSPVVGNPDDPKKDRQRWRFALISKTSEEIKKYLTLNDSFKGDVPSFSYGDVPYVIIPDNTRKQIWQAAELPKAARPGVFDEDSFAWTLKSKVATWASNNLKGNNFTLAYGVAFIKKKNGTSQAVNWYLSSDLQKILLFDPVKGKEIDLLSGSKVFIAVF